MGEIRKLNMLRGVAALIVVLSHYTNRTGIFDEVLGHGAGQLGVMLFFMLSGFLMGHLYLGRPASPAELRSFAVARIARVLPLFLVVVLASYVFTQQGQPKAFYNIPDQGSLWSHLLLLSGVSVLWTIPPEMHFYALFCGFWWLYARNGARAFLLVAATFVLLALVGFPDLRWQLGTFKIDGRILTTLPYFLAGLCFAELYRWWKVPREIQRHWYCATLLLLPLLYPQVSEGVLNHTHDLWQDASVLAVIAFVFFAVVFLVPDTNVLLANRFGDFIGRISFSVYLLHIPLIHLVLPTVKKQPYDALLVYLAGCFIVSELSFRFLEDPARSWIKRRFARSDASETRRRHAVKRRGRCFYRGTEEFSATTRAIG